MFYNDTGIMAPGKSVPAELLQDMDYHNGKQETMWKDWQEKNKSHIRAVYSFIVDAES